jgi:hypothetical protein
LKMNPFLAKHFSNLIISFSPKWGIRSLPVISKIIAFLVSNYVWRLNSNHKKIVFDYALDFYFSTLYYLSKTLRDSDILCHQRFALTYNKPCPYPMTLCKHDIQK